MVWILLALAAVVALGACTVAVRLYRRQSFPASAGPAPQRRCVRCRGTGWLNTEPERTLNFTGSGFEDKHTPSTPCPDCHSTGMR